MSLISEIEKLMGEIGSSVHFKIINLGGSSLYIQGFKSLVSISEEEMRFQIKNGLIIVSGEKLNIKYLDTSSCVVIGQIKAVQTI